MTKTDPHAGFRAEGHGPPNGENYLECKVCGRQTLLGEGCFVNWKAEDRRFMCDECAIIWTKEKDQPQESAK